VIQSDEDMPKHQVKVTMAILGIDKQPEYNEPEASGMMQLQLPRRLSGAKSMGG